MALNSTQDPNQRPRTLLGRLRLSLPRLDALLRAEGFVVGPDRWQNVYDLLLVLQERGRMPPQAAALRPLLTPLFCKDADEQMRFAQVFRRWLDELAQQPGAVPESPGAVKESPPQPPPKPSLRRLIIGLLLALLVLTTGIYGVMRFLSNGDEPVTPVENGERLEPPSPPETLDSPAQLEASLELQPLPPRTPLPEPNLNAVNQDRLFKTKVFAVLLPAFLMGGFLAARWLNWSLVLRRRRGREGVPLHAITLDAGQDDLFNGQALREALKRLHTPVAAPTRRLDATATVYATAKAGGLFQPVLRQRRRVPDCIVLLDHAHGADQMAGLALQAVDRLRQAGLEVVRYDYQRDPRQLMGEDRRWHSLAQVAARHEGARLLVMGEAASLVNPLTHALYRWTDVIERWPQRGLLSTRRPPDAWRAALAARQFLVADLSSEGLSQVALWFNPVFAEPVTAPVEPLRQLPRLLQDDEVWLQPVAPPTVEQDTLLRTLRVYLGVEGLLLLTAMAAYPQLHWGLTRALDVGLFHGQPAARREQRLLRVARLPWCRAGGLPDWLRKILRGNLDAAEVNPIAQLYQWLMREAEVNGHGTISLPVSLPESGYFWRRLRRWLYFRGQVIDRYDPCNDRVFVEMLLGRRARLLDFRLPRPLARRFGRLLNALLPRLALGVLMALGAGWGIHWIWNGWIQEPAQAWLLAQQLQGHEAITVDIWHTEDTEHYAQALAQTLRKAQFQVVVEPHELAMSPPEPQVQNSAGQRVQSQPVNAVQWATSSDEDAALYVANRLGYLAWGNVPIKVSPGAELPLTGPGLDETLPASRLRVLLLTPAEGYTGFRFRDPMMEAGTAAPRSVFRDALKDGGEGPEMVMLPGGSFQMGSPDDESGRSSDEGPQREVRIRPFAMGRTEVTFADYDVFAEATGREKPSDRGWGRGQQPVINVSWNDAVAYAAWLSEQTGERYRLPTEAEWEYAARAGTETPFWTGDCIHTDQANYLGQKYYNNCGAKTDVYRGQTVEAGSLPANDWGLHETAGNVYEYVQDCWHDDYQGGPTDGSAWEEPNCTWRVIRGGGWNTPPGGVRSANRDRYYPDAIIVDQSFRLARDL